MTQHTKKPPLFKELVKHLEKWTEAKHCDDFDLCMCIAKKLLKKYDIQKKDVEVLFVAPAHDFMCAEYKWLETDIENYAQDWILRRQHCGSNISPQDMTALKNHVVYRYIVSTIPTSKTYECVNSFSDASICNITLLQLIDKIYFAKVCRDSQIGDGTCEKHLKKSNKRKRTNIV